MRGTGFTDAQRAALVAMLAGPARVEGATFRAAGDVVIRQATIEALTAAGLVRAVSYKTRDQRLTDRGRQVARELAP